MRRRQLLRALSAILGGASLPASLRAAGQTIKPFVWRNWSGAQSCIPASRAAPDSEQALADWLAQARGPIRPVGAAHSFSSLIPTDGHILSLDRLAGMICYDEDQQTADFWAGTRLSEAGEAMLSVGQGWINLSDIDYQTLAGAMNTATHGTGISLGTMPTQISALRLLTPGGELLDCDAQQNPEIFEAARVGLGALGIVTRYRLQNRERYKLRQRDWMARTEDLLDAMPALVANNRHFEMMPLLHSEYSLAIAANETDDAPTVPPTEDESGYISLLRALDKYGSDLPALRSALLDLVGSQVEFPERVGWNNRILATVRNVRWNEMEYQVPAEAGPDCLREILRTVKQRNLRSWFPLEYRYVKGDELWLSPFHGRDSCSISVHQFHDMDYHGYFAAIEPIFWKYGGRPHWGKLHSLNHHALKELYPRWQDFLAVREQLDPQGRMLNGHLRQLFGVHA